MRRKRTSEQARSCRPSDSKALLAQRHLTISVRQILEQLFKLRVEFSLISVARAKLRTQIMLTFDICIEVGPNSGSQNRPDKASQSALLLSEIESSLHQFLLDCRDLFRPLLRLRRDVGCVCPPACDCDVMV